MMKHELQGVSVLERRGKVVTYAQYHCSCGRTDRTRLRSRSADAAEQAKTLHEMHAKRQTGGDGE